MDKKIKDPIYGYVKIPVEYMEEIIDKAEIEENFTDELFSIIFFCYT